MENFAEQIAEAGTAESIAQVFDQYLNFIVGEPDLFSLAMGKDIYWALNSAQTKDEEIDSVVDRTVSGLFSVVVTMGKLIWRLTSTTASDGVDRLNTNHSLSARCSCRSHSCEARS